MIRSILLKWNLMITTEEQTTLHSWRGTEELSRTWPNWIRELLHVWQLTTTVHLWQNHWELHLWKDKPVLNLKSYRVGMSDCCFCNNWLSVAEYYWIPTLHYICNSISAGRREDGNVPQLYTLLIYCTVWAASHPPILFHPLCLLMKLFSSAISLGFWCDTSVLISRPSVIGGPSWLHPLWVKER